MTSDNALLTSGPLGRRCRNRRIEFSATTNLYLGMKSIPDDISAQQVFGRLLKFSAATTVQLQLQNREKSASLKFDTSRQHIHQGSESLSPTELIYEPLRLSYFHKPR